VCSPPSINEGLTIVSRESRPSSNRYLGKQTEGRVNKMLQLRAQRSKDALSPVFLHMDGSDDCVLRNAPRLRRDRDELGRGHARLHERICHLKEHEQPSAFTCAACARKPYLCAAAAHARRRRESCTAVLVGNAKELGRAQGADAEAQLAPRERR
jgi:hypothetical protein